MPFNVPSAISVGAKDSVRLLDGVNRGSLVDELRNTLGVGKILDVMVSGDSSPDGVLIEGQHFPAQLPEGARPGQKLSVKVLDNRDAVVLKVLHNPQAATSLKTSLLSTSPQLLGQLLNLREASLLKQARLIPAQKNLTLDKAGIVQNLLRQILSSDLVVSEKAASDKDELQRILKQLSKLNRSTVPHLQSANGAEPKRGKQGEEQLGEVAAQFKDMWESQGLNNDLNPLLHSLGQSALLMIPALLNGSLLRWDLLANPLPSLSTPADDDKTGMAYERLTLSLTLPALGKTRVELAHRAGEVLLSLTLESSEKAAFVKRQLPSLEKALKVAGKSTLLLTVKEGIVSELAPNWFSMLTSFSEVV